MARLPDRFQPRVVIRRKAIRSGVLGPSTFWKVVAVFVYGRNVIKRFFAKHPESLGTFAIDQNSFLNIISIAPTSSRERKRCGLTRQVVVDRAVDAVAAGRPGRKIRVKKIRVKR